MRRKSLSLLLIAPLLLVLLLTQLADVQAARPLQADATPIAPAADATAQPALDAGITAGVPFTQPLLLRVRQQVPITIALALLRPVTVTATPTATEPVTVADVLTSALTVSPTVRPSATPTQTAATEPATTEPLTGSTGLTLSVAPTTADAITGATVITGLLPLTTEAPITTADTVALTLTAPLTDALTTPDSTTVPTVELTVPAGTPAVGDLVPLTGTLPLTGVLPLTAALPLTNIAPITPSVALTDVPALFEGIGITMDLDLQFIVTDTMTSTVPAILVLRFSGMPSMTLPVSITVNAPATALVSVLPVTSTVFPLTGTTALTLTDGLTDTGAVTDATSLTGTEGVTPTATPLDLNALNVVTVTVPVTANVRSAPDLNAEIAQTVPGGTVLSIVGKNAAGDWLLLQDGNWIAVVVFGAAPPDLIVGDETLAAALREAAANAPPTPTPLPPPPTATPTPTPTLPPFTPVSVTTTTNANLRAGPGTTFDIVGNTTLGQAVIVTARDATGGWLLLDSNSWIAVQLVQGLPAIETIPVFDPNAPPTPTPVASDAAIPTATVPGVTVPVTGTAAVTTTPAAPLLPTATPAAPVPTATAEPVTLTVDENVYLVEFDNIVANYQRALTAIDRLVTSASGNTAVFDDQQWVTDMNTAIQLLRNASPAVARLSVPERFAAAQNSLANAVTQYNQAADLLTAGVGARDTAQFDAAFSAIAQGDASVAQASAALSAFRP